MAIRPRPPFPSIDPIDPCLKLGAQLAYIREAVNYSKGLLTRSSGSAFVNRRQSLLFRELEETFASYASDWERFGPAHHPAALSRPLPNGHGTAERRPVDAQHGEDAGRPVRRPGQGRRRLHDRRAHLLNMMTT